MDRKDGSTLQGIAFFFWFLIFKLTEKAEISTYIRPKSFLVYIKLIVHTYLIIFNLKYIFHGKIDFFVRNFFLTAKLISTEF